MDNTCLTTIMFNKLSQLYQNNLSVPFQYFSNLKCLFETRGMGHVFEHMDNLSLDVFKYSVYATHQDICTRGVDNYVSLQTYKWIKDGISHPGFPMINCFNVRAAQLKM